MTGTGGLKPPSRLAARTLPVRAVPAHHELVRIHSRDRHPLHFSRGPGRWDDPRGVYGVCYVTDGDTPWGTVAETLLHDPATTVIEEGDLESRALSRIRLVGVVEVVAFHGSGLRRLGADVSVTSGPRDHSGVWGAAIQAHPSASGGIVWRARPDDDAFSVAIFDRVRASLRIEQTLPLLHPELLPTVASWLDRYGIAVG